MARFDREVFSSTAMFRGVTLPSARYGDPDIRPPQTSFDRAKFLPHVPVEMRKFVSPGREAGER